MRNKILFALCLILLTGLTSAELIVSPTSVNLDGNINQNIVFNLNLTNTFNFTIQDFQFSNMQGLSFTPFTLTPNQTKNIQLILNKNSPTTQNISSTIIFNYLVEVPSSPQTHQVNISDTEGFQPQEITIYQGDTIIWKNNGQISHTVTSNEFDSPISPQGTFQRTFNDIKTMDYIDSIVFFTGKINVLNRSNQQPVHNPSYDKTINFNLDILQNPTTLNLELLENSFTLEFADTSEGILKVTNTGSNEATQIILKSESNWISFDENNFSLQPNTNNFVTFQISPFITSTSETNKTYNIEISSKASNSQKVLGNISIFIPYKSLAELNDSNVNDFFKAKLVFCREFPTSPFCITEPSIVEKNVTIIKEPPIPYNFTQVEIATIFTRLQKIEDGSQRTNNELKRALDVISQQYPEIRDILNKTEIRSIETERRRASFSRNWTIIIGFIFIIACVIAITFFIRRYNLIKSLSTNWGIN